MKWFPILLFVLALVAGYSPQFSTPQPVRRYGVVLFTPKTVIRFGVEVVRL